LQPAFDQMVDKIVFTYKFTTLPNIDILREECKIWLMTVLGKFNPDKGSKAFSYFSVITKNWFIQKVKKNKKKSLQAFVSLSKNKTELQKMLDDNLELRYKNVEKKYIPMPSTYINGERWNDEIETEQKLNTYDTRQKHLYT
jgi:hypothetical protein